MIVNVGKVRMKIPRFSYLHNFGPDEIFESGGSGIGAYRKLRKLNACG